MSQISRVAAVLIVSWLVTADASRGDEVTQRPDGPKALAELRKLDVRLVRDYTGSVIAVYGKFEKRKTADAAFARLGDLPNLRTVEFTGAGMSDDGLWLLKNL